MRVGEIADFCLDMWDAGIKTPVMLLGPPGIGKSSIGQVIADKMTEQVQKDNPSAPPALHQILDLSTMLPEDLLGLPWRNGDVTDYAAHRWVAANCEVGAYGVLVVDDITQAAPSLQVASRGMILEYAIHNHIFAPGIFILVTGNRREDKAAASTLPSPFRNSVCMLQVEPEIEEWCTWYGQQAGAPVVASYLRYRPASLSKLPKDACKNGAFATPRTWSKLGSMYDLAKKRGMLFDVATGLVGEGLATEFVGFDNIRDQLVNPVEVMKNPEAALPNPRETLNSPDRAYAMTTGLGEVAAQWMKTSKRKAAPLAFIKAVTHCTVGNREYIATAVNTFCSNGGNIGALTRCVEKHGDDPHVCTMMDFLEKIL